MYMVNYQSDKSTLLKWNNYKFRVALKDADFSEASLKCAH